MWGLEESVFAGDSEQVEVAGGTVNQDGLDDAFVEE